MAKPVSDPFRALILLGAAVVCAGLGNSLARPDRRLAWAAGAPPPAATPGPALSPAVAPPVPAPAPAPQAAPAPKAAPVPRAVTPRPAPATQARAPEPSTSAAPAPAPADAPAPARFDPAPDAVIRDLSPQEAWAAFQQHIPFLDARRSADYLAGHVAGAWSVPIWEADADARITDFEARAKPAAKSPLVLYCAGGDCQDSRVLADKLVGLGYRNLFIYRDGFPDWARRNRPRQQGPHP